MNRPPHIGIVAMPLEGGRSGIGVYIREMVRALSRRDDMRVSVFGFSNERELLDIGPSARFVAVPGICRPLPTNLFWHSNALMIQALARRLDVLFLPAGNRRMPLLPLRLKRPRIAATVHDLAHFHLSDKYDRARTFYVTRLLPRAWRRADLILSPSHATARDLDELAGVSPEHCSIIWNGVDHSAFHPIPREEARRKLPETLNLPERYILYVSRIEHPGKNHETLLKAYQALLARQAKLPQDLVFCGADWSGAQAVHRLSEELGIGERVHFTGFLEQSLLPFLYCASDLFAFPSRFEGFGIPAIEAMACSVPVIASDRASLPEIVGEAGLIVDAEDAPGWTDALEKGIYDDAFRARAVERGQARVSLFSWERSARQTARALLTLAKQATR